MGSLQSVCLTSNQRSSQQSGEDRLSVVEGRSMKTTPDLIRPTSEQIAAVRDLYERGQMMSAYELATSYGPLKHWRGAEARIMAGRLAGHIGAPRLSYLSLHFATLEDPTYPEAIYYGARNEAGRKGPLAGWKYMQRYTPTKNGDLPLPGAEDYLQADWFAFESTLLAFFRDFEQAERSIDRALEIAPDRAWIWVERAELYEREDRYPDALKAAERSLELQPWFRAGVQQVAHTLQLLDRDQDALKLLTEATDKLQSGAIVTQLAVLQTELGHYADARASWDRVLELSPMADKHFKKFLAARRSDAAYYCGDIPQAIEQAKISDGKFHKKVAEKLEQSDGQAARRLLQVPFVRQHYVTCAPATLSALSRYWSMPAEHLSVAEEICYDGTPAHSERQWATRNGYVAREFKVTWDTAAALIDRGIPFTLTTVEATSAHLQAVIGYDGLRGTLLIRDPFMRISGEFISDAFFDRYKASGPRGMVMVPQAKAHLLDGIELPEASLYDGLYALMSALVEHRREDAQREYDALHASDPGHRITLSARRSLAAYDGDHATALSVLEDELKLFPDDGRLALQRLSYLRGIGRRQERLQTLRDLTASKEADPVFWTYLALELKDDARDHDEAMRLVRKAIRQTRGDTRNYHTLAGLLWEEDRRDDALLLYRFAATMDDKSDQFAQSYFAASRHLKQTRQVIHMLRDRFNRFGRKNPTPAMVLFGAYEQIDQPGEAFKTLEQAIAWRPEDGELLLMGANAHGRYGEFAKAEELLARAKTRSRAASWLRGSAEIATFRGDTERARELWRQLVEQEPLAIDAHRQYAVLLAQTGGPAMAIRHLQAACQRFPYNLPLNQIRIGWLLDEGDADVESEIRRHLEMHPTDTVTRRQLIWSLAMQQKHDEAEVQAKELLHLDPHDPTNHHVVGKLKWTQGDYTEARAAFRRAIEISVDADFAVSDLVRSCDSAFARREQLDFVREQLVKQTLFGDGLLAFRDVAADTLDPQELLTELQQALAARSDLWHAHAAVMKQLAEMNRLPEAAAAGHEATQRFPLLPRIWAELATVYRLQNDTDAEVAALEQALALSPGWSTAVRQLAETYERRGELEKARSLLEAAAARDPLEVATLGCLADIRWQLGDREQAFQEVCRAVTLEPGYQWAWDAARRWSEELKRPEAAVELARELTRKRGGEARSWMVLARTLPAPEPAEAKPSAAGNATAAEPPPDERLTAIEKAIALSPRTVDAHDLRALILYFNGRVADARAACRPPVFGSRQPVELRAREAWILSASGDHDEAIRRMRKILDEDPGYYPGWVRLLDWYRLANNKDAFVETAGRMVKAWPHDANALNCYGDARLASDDREGAIQAYRRAIEVAPDHYEALVNLYDLQIDDNHLEDAERLLSMAERVNPNPFAAARRVRLLVRHGDRDGALRAMAKLCVETDEDWPLRHAVGAIMDGGWRADLERVLIVAIKQPDCAPLVGELLIRVVDERARPGELELLTDDLVVQTSTTPTLTFTPPVAQAVRRTLITLCDKAREQNEMVLGTMDLLKLPGKLTRSATRRLMRYVDRRRELFRSDTGVWGTVGYTFHTLRDYPRAIAWLSDWRDRPTVEGWMTLNLAEAHRALGDDTEAAAIHEACFDSATGSSRVMHGLWRAYDALTRGDTAQAKVHLAEVAGDMGLVHDAYHFFRAMLETTHSVLAADDPVAIFPAAKQAVREAVAGYPHFSRDRELRRAFLRCTQMIAEAVGTLGAKVWKFNQRV